MVDKPKVNNDSTQVKRIPLVVTYNPANPRLVPLIAKYWPMLKSSHASEAFTENPLLAHRRLQNISDNLVRATLEFPPKSPGTTGVTVQNYTQDCDATPCTMCQNMDKSRTFKSKYTKRQYTKTNRTKTANCSSRNLVYMLTCSTCNSQYVGETKREFKVRIKEHLADIKHHRDTPVARHVHTHQPSAQGISYQVLEILPQNPDNPETTPKRRIREMFWIHQLRTMHPHGLNSRDDLSITIAHFQYIYFTTP